LDIVWLILRQRCNRDEDLDEEHSDLRLGSTPLIQLRQFLAVARFSEHLVTTVQQTNAASKQCAVGDRSVGERCRSCRPERPDATQSRKGAQKFWETEWAMLRDRMAEEGLAVVAWNGDENLDITLGALMRRRRAGRVSSRRRR
jgi:hypothetical protein